MHAFAGTEVNAKSSTVNFLVVEHAGVIQGLARSGQGEARVEAAVHKPFRVGHMLCEVKVSHLCRELGGECAGIEMTNRPDATAAFAGVFEQTLHGQA